ncbi:MAG: nucleotide exchange factor GrpE [Bacillota bacterium]
MTEKENDVNGENGCYDDENKEQNENRETEVEQEAQNKEEQTEEESEELTELSPEEEVEVLNNEVEELKEENETLKTELEDFKKRYQRLKADFVNYRKRTQKEKDGLGLQAQIELLEEVLPVLDNFERALKTAEDEGDLKEGIELIYKQLFNTLKQKGLEKIESEGQPFDHKYHEAIMQLEDSDQESGVVVEELQKGYMFQGKVIRPAMVKVAE